MAKKSSVSRNDLIFALLYILAGVFFFVFKGGALNILFTIVGALFVVSGIVVLIANRDFLSAAICIVIGLVLLLGGWLFAEIVILVFGILCVVKGIADFAQSVKRKSVFGVIAALLVVALGVLLILDRWFSTVRDWFFIAIGVIFIVNGLLLLIGGISSKGKKRR